MKRRHTLSNVESGGRDGDWLHRFAFFTACCTFLLVIAGGLVTSTGSGLAVPDWPLSYGQLMPPMVGGIFYEHGHRMVATFVGALTTILAIWLWRKDSRKWVRTLGLVAFLAVLIQGILGGLTVLYLLPTPISVTHATLAQSFFSLVVFLALVTSKSWKDPAPAVAPGGGKLRQWAVVTSSVIFIQLILGAIMRHTGSGLAIPDFPSSFGNLLPPFSGVGLGEANAYRLDLGLQPVTGSQVMIQFLHRIWAIVVAVVTLICVRRVLVIVPREPVFREPAIMMGLLLVVQFFLGALTVWTGKNVQVTTGHVATGALLLATSVVLSARVIRFVKEPGKELELITSKVSAA